MCLHPLLVSDASPSSLGLNALLALGHSISLHLASGATSGQLTIQGLIAQFCSNKGGMAVDPATLEIDGDVVFLKRRVLPCGQR